MVMRSCTINLLCLRCVVNDFSLDGWKKELHTVIC